jgi:hypothetical protein
MDVIYFCCWFSTDNLEACEILDQMSDKLLSENTHLVLSKNGYTRGTRNYINIEGLRF